MIQLLRKNSKLIRPLLLLFLSSSALALPTDRQRPLFVNSKHWEYNYKTGISINTGNVVADQGTSHLTADKVITYHDQHDEVTKVIAFGNPAHYSTILDFNTPTLYTQANTIAFFPQQNHITLKGNALAQRGVDSVAAPTITYDISQKRMLTDAPPPQISHIVIVNKPNNPQPQGLT